MNANQDFLKAVIIAAPHYGASTYSWQLKEQLEAMGHVVWYFCPRAQPWLFTCEGRRAGLECWRISMHELARFFEVQSPDLVFFADGVLPDDLGGAALEPEEPSLRFGVICDGQAQARRVSDASCGFDFAIGCDIASTLGLRRGKVAREFFTLDAHPCEAYFSTPLANTIALERGILCVQDATPERIDTLRSLLDDSRYEDMPVRCFGIGWPVEWTCVYPGAQADASFAADPSAPFNAFTYASRSSECCVIFDDCEIDCPDYPPSYALRLLEQEGCELLAIADIIASSHAPAQFANVMELGDVLCALMGKEELSVVATQANARPLVTVLGYFGFGNFGDELILQTIDARVRAANSSHAVIAISENPRHTLAHRGMYAIELSDKQAIDQALERSSVALVTAGLLFDQGLRWTCGIPEMFSNTWHSDLPALADYATHAKLKGATCIFYGIGAGPLDLPDSRKFVSFMGSQGVRFIARDEESAQLIRDCGVPSEQVSAQADIAHLVSVGESFGGSFMLRKWMQRNVAEPGERELLVISLRDYEGQPDDFKTRIAHALDAYCEDRPAVLPVFCALDPADANLARRIMEELESMGSSLAPLVFDADNDIDALVEFLGFANVGLSMRYHCALLLMSQGVPCVGLDYLPKVGSLFKSMGATDLLLPLDAEAQDVSEALERATGDVSAHDARKRSLDAAELEARAKAQQAEDMLMRAIEDNSDGSERLALGRVFYMFDRQASMRQLMAQQHELAVAHDRIRELERQLEETHAEVQDVRNSTSLKVGLAVTALPRAINRKTKGLDHE